MFAASSALCFQTNKAMSIHFQGEGTVLTHEHRETLKLMTGSIGRLEDSEQVVRFLTLHAENNSQVQIMTHTKSLNIKPKSFSQLISTVTKEQNGPLDIVLSLKIFLPKPEVLVTSFIRQRVKEATP